MTPTQDLLMDVLAARYRTGEHMWTFDVKHKKNLEALEEMGFVSLMHGIVEKTVRASLTPGGRTEAMGVGLYMSPIEKDLQRALAERDACIMALKVIK